MRAQKRKKQTAVDHFGGKCQICGYSKCLDALEFHHTEKDEKEESPSYIILRWSWKRVLKELEKCILVCSNCHREIHSKKDFDFDIKSLVKPWLTIECCQCHTSFETKDYRQKYCSTSCKQLSDRRVTRPSRSELKSMMEQKIPWTHLGKKFSVSANAVKKWAKRYELV